MSTKSTTNGSGASKHRSGPSNRSGGRNNPPQRDRAASSRSRLRQTANDAPQRMLNFNSLRTAWILSLLLMITLITQFLLVTYHDALVLHINSLEEEVLEDMAAINSLASDALNAAYEYNGNDAYGTSVGDSGVGSDNAHPDRVHSKGGSGRRKEIIPTKLSKYSMEPEDILKRAGVDYSEGYVPSITVREAIRNKRKQQMNQKQQASLPPLEEIQSMYGNHSYILGLDRCAAFRNAVHPPERRLMGPAGMFNSATNLLNKLLKLNCVNEARHQQRKKYGRNGPNGMLLQAPWGKHNPVAWRLHHNAAVMWKGVVQEDFLPIVMTKDPITWMSSMCRHPYEARWRHTSQHCPNLVPNEFDRGRSPGKGEMGVKVKWATSLHDFSGRPAPDARNKTFVPYRSLAHLWNEWYGEWRDATFPRLMVRFEDLLFHAEETIGEVCECGGGTVKKNFRYVEDSAKGQGGPHAGSAGFLASLITYGNRTLRMEGILKERADVEYAREHLDGDLMDLFGYAPI